MIQQHLCRVLFCVVLYTRKKLPFLNQDGASSGTNAGRLLSVAYPDVGRQDSCWPCQ